MVNGTLRAGAMLVSVLLEALLVRALLPADYATWGVALSFSLIAIVLTQFGYQTSAIKIFARFRDGNTQGFHSALVGASMVWALAALLLLVIFAFAFGIFFPLETDPELFWAIYAMTITRGVNTALAEGMRGTGHIVVSASLGGLGQHGGLIRTLGFGAAVAVLYFTGALDLANALWASALVSLIASAIIVSVAVKAIPDQKKVSMASAISAIRTDLPSNIRLMSAQFLQLGSSRFAANLVGGALALGPALAPYIIAQQISQLLLAPLTVLNGAIPNLIIEAHARKDRDELEKIMRAASTVAFLASVIGCVILVSAGPGFFRLVFGPDQGTAYTFFLILVPGFLFNSYTGSAARALALLGEEHAYAVTSLFTALAAIPLYIIGGMFWNAAGLALVTSVVLIGQNIVYLMLVRARLGVHSHAMLDPRKIRPALRNLKRCQKNKVPR